jgi:light-regulated signal transduction histidine kinase (bacteriophytochrome)
MSEGGLELLSREYGKALGDFLVRFDETARLAAYELGRQALAEGVALLDVITIHHLALNSFIAHAHGKVNRVWLSRAGEFLGECLSPFEMSQRGYQEANQGLRRMNEVLREKNEEISRANRELEAFSYSVAHDLRAPLRSIDGFSRILLRDNAAQLDESGREYLSLVRESAQRMGHLLEDMLNLARYSRAELHLQPVDLAAMARETMGRIRQEQPERSVDFVVPDTLPARGDAGLLAAVLENLLANAWKYSRPRETARIEFGWSPQEDAYFVRDNGVGFDMAYAGKLFKVFQRLHSVAQFEGTGVGLAIVERIIDRHGGRVWADSHLDQGSTFFFTLPAGQTTENGARNQVGTG